MRDDVKFLIKMNNTIIQANKDYLKLVEANKNILKKDTYDYLVKGFKLNISSIESITEEDIVKGLDSK